MKKLLAIIAISGFVACNNSGEGETPAADTTTVEAPVTADTTAITADTTATVDTTAAAQ